MGTATLGYPSSANHFRHHRHSQEFRYLCDRLCECPKQGQREVRCLAAGAAHALWRQARYGNEGHLLGHTQRSIRSRDPFDRGQFDRPGRLFHHLCPRSQAKSPSLGSRSRRIRQRSTNTREAAVRVLCRLAVCRSDPRRMECFLRHTQAQGRLDSGAGGWSTAQDRG